MTLYEFSNTYIKKIFTFLFIDIGPVKVLSIEDKDITSKKGEKFSLTEIKVGDPSGSLTLTLWGGDAVNVQTGDIIKIGPPRALKAKSFNAKKGLSGSKGKVVLEEVSYSSKVFSKSFRVKTFNDDTLKKV